MKIFSSLALSLLVAGAAVASDSSETFITIGDPAPSIKSATWLKGEPVVRFEPGRVYIVEFWATWCGPCKENIPHLTEMAQKYKDKVSIIGISIWENLDDEESDPLAKVKAFVSSQGEKMDYLVAADGSKNTIADAWMKPASEGGIPCSFLIDGKGRIAWIGHPAKMEGVLNQLLDGTYDIDKAREAREVELKHTRPISQHLERREYAELLKAIDAAVAEKPSLEYSLTYNRFVALFHVDLEEGKRYAKKVFEESNEAPGAYHMMSAVFAAYEDISPEGYKYGLTLADKGIEKDPNNIMLKAIKAEINFHLKDKKAAFAAIKVAIDQAKASEFATAELVEMLEKSLVKYQEMKD